MTAPTLEEPADDHPNTVNKPAGPDSETLNNILGKLDAITGDMKGLRTEIGEVKVGIQDVNNTTSQMDTKIEQELREIKTVLKQTKQELDTSNKRLAMTEQLLAASNSAYASLSKRLTTLENKGRICNILIDGIEENEGEDLRQIVIDISQQICPGKLTLESFDAIYRLGRRNTNGTRRRSRVVMVCFKDQRTRNLFYYARTKLKENDKLKGIYLNDDVTPETKRARDEYRSVANLARADGAVVRIHDDGLVLDGTKYKLFEPESLPTKYSLGKAKTMETPQGIFFHSESSFLSNFFPSPIWADNTAYPTAEHRYQSIKCKMAGELMVMKRVMAAASPMEAKRMADAIPETAEWRCKRDGIMEMVIDEKFKQNISLATKLLDTGKAKLYEATANMHYGIGATLHSREVRDMSFKGLNRLGEILQNIRDELSAPKPVPQPKDD